MVATLVVLAAIVQSAEPALEFREGDRVVLLGSTFIERDQVYGHLESRLTARFADRKLTFRNLGWSGDTVFGHARAGFDSVADGFKRLRQQTANAKPNVLIIGYGTNEAFEGEAGLPAFVKGLDALLDAVEPTKARIILLSPLKLEDMGRPLPDPTESNRRLRLYADAVRDTAAKRKHRFVNLFELVKSTDGKPLTDNGIHLSDRGHLRLAQALEAALGLSDSPIAIDITTDAKVASSQGTVVSAAAGSPLRFETLDAHLPSGARTIRIRGLGAGSHTLLIDGKAAATGSAADWKKGVAVTAGPEFEQYEKLRAKVIAKNRLFFHRWRPQNETYLFGFRKHEQGNNAVEVDKFDPLIAVEEAEIQATARPVKHKCEIGSTK